MKGYIIEYCLAFQSRRTRKIWPGWNSQKFEIQTPHTTQRILYEWTSIMINFVVVIFIIFLSLLFLLYYVIVYSLELNPNVWRVDHLGCGLHHSTKQPPSPPASWPTHHLCRPAHHEDQEPCNAHTHKDYISVFLVLYILHVHTRLHVILYTNTYSPACT